MAYQLGLREHRLALSLKAHISAQPAFWKRPTPQPAHRTADVHIHTTN